MKRVRRKQMTRGLVVATALGALAFAAAALGASKSYFGSDSDSQCGVVPHTNCDITFDATVKTGKVTRVKNFTYDGIPMHCNEGDFAFTIKGNPLPTMRVNAHRRFAGHFHTASGNERDDVTGKFSKNYKSVTGTVQVQGDFPPQATGCDTGVDRYSATRLVTGGG